METLEEARYLTAIFNSDALRQRISGQQSRGQWGARDIHKLLVSQPIPRFAARKATHRSLVELAEYAERIAAAVEFPPEMYFVTARRRIRDALTNDGVAEDIDKAVDQLLRAST